jgi:hypothetical protein
MEYQFPPPFRRILEKRFSTDFWESAERTVSKVRHRHWSTGDWRDKERGKRLTRRQLFRLIFKRRNRLSGFRCRGLRCNVVVVSEQGEMTGVPTTLHPLCTLKKLNGTGIPFKL